MTIRILRADGHRRMPWKNGRGETVEIAVFPEGAGLDAFAWRISMAGVAEDGEFSIFPGIDRTLAVLSGAGIELQVQKHGLHRLTPDDPPLAFPADIPSSARLIDGPITDLNVMTRRGVHAHRMIRSDDTATAPCDLRLVLATERLSLRAGGKDFDLAPLDALICDGPDAVLPPEPVAGGWMIEIRRV
ncbi:HutD family protein [Paracoccus sp. MBLB3053]|uniref:HutD family protein n=1 Tax=Paracoccus aurantius TaxID=3073814 RepID=A0ABU2HRT5_9RHOB|nr:HutD family protein [Paracoccus sp. MBLB3053]MDS9467742.1 HutD family protein [Paracoccus sp. MBLB3053]